MKKNNSRNLKKASAKMSAHGSVQKADRIATPKAARKSKVEKRRLAFEKRNAKRERNVVRYGAEGGSALVMAKTADFNRRFIAAFLALVFAISCMVVGFNFATKADDASDPYHMQTKTENGLVVSKGLKNNGNGTYDLKLEAYATGTTSTTASKKDVPLDIVLVLDQSGSMLEQDTYQGYNEIAPKNFTVEEANGKYYYDDEGNGPYQLTYDTVYKTATISVNEPYGDEVNSWTAEKANTWKTTAKASGLQNNGKLYYCSNNNYEEVKESKDYYRNVGNNVRIYGNFTANANKFGNTWNLLSARESDGGIDNTGSPLWTYNLKSTGEPFWHQIYSASLGSLGEGYYLTLYYYTNTESGTSISGSRIDTYSSSGFDNALGNNTITLLGNGIEGYGWTWGGGNWTNSAAYYTNGDMYVPATSSKYVKLYTDSQTLAWPIPGSSTETTTYEGPLYAKGYQLYYIDENEIRHDVGNTVWKLTDNALYDVPLYEKNWTSRLDSLKIAASQFVEQIGERAAETGADHRIAVVGFANNEVPSVSSTSRNNIVDVDDGASEFITTNTGIFINGAFKSYMTPILPANGTQGMVSTGDPDIKNITYFYKDSVWGWCPVRHRDDSYTYWKDNYQYISNYWLMRTTKDNGYEWYNYKAWNDYSSQNHYYPDVSTLSSQNYKDALVSVKANDKSGNKVNDYVDTALSKLNAYGGTYISYGLAMAQGVFKNNSNVQEDGTTRKRIVVVFTDGQPGGGGETWDTAAANEAVATAAKLKDKYEASVYTVGLYKDNPSVQVEDFMSHLSSEYFTSTSNVYASSTGTNAMTLTNEKYYFEDDEGRVHSVKPSKSGSGSGNSRYYGDYFFTNEKVGNRSIPVTSHSNGAHRQIYWSDSEGWLRGAKWDDNDSRTNFWQFFTLNNPELDQNGTYYYRASDGENLSSVFTEISDSIQTPTTTVSLNADAVLRDIVSDNFILPDNPESKVSVFAYEGEMNGSQPTFSETALTPEGISKSFGAGDESQTLSVTGFDFGKEYIATGHKGKKLVVTISGLTLKKGAISKDYDENGFMKIPSNTPDSGIYKSSTGDDSFATFPVPYALVDPDATERNGMVLSKKIGLNAQNSYNLTLQAYSTGQSFNEQIPTDYVLVVDQSGSMSAKDVPKSYSSNGTTKEWKVSDGEVSDKNPAYYYKVTDKSGDHYYRVYQKRGYMFQYHAQDSIYSGSCVDNNLGWFQSETDQDVGKASQYWYNPSLDTSGSRVGSSTDNRFYPVTVSARGEAAYYAIRFRYTNIDGISSYLTYPNQPYYKSPTGGKFGPGDRWGLVISYNTANSTCKALTGNNKTKYTYGKFLGINTGMYVRQVLFTRRPGYSQLAYKDDSGVEHLLIDATYCNSKGTPMGGSCDENGNPAEGPTSTTEAYWHGTLYQASETVTRLEALKASMTEFVNTVAKQNAHHRVAIAGFSSLSSEYTNTELLTGTDLTIQNQNGVQYNDLTVANYRNALLDVTKSENASLDPSGNLANGKLKDAIDALTAKGGTEGEFGLYMAKSILDNRSETTFTTGDGKTMDRLMIIVYFTDGTPGNYANDNQYAYGNKVVDAASKIKSSATLRDAEIYSIGTFGFADAEPLTYQKYSGSNSEYTYDPDYVETSGSSHLYRIWLRNTKGYGDVATDTVSDYMRTVSSEYPSATKFVDATWYGTSSKSDSGVYTDMVDRVRGAASGGRHYFLCTDLSALSRTFVTVASEKQTGGTSMDAGTILRDTIDKTRFDYDNATVTATVKSIDINGSEVNEVASGTPIVKTWDNGKSISDDGVVEVTGIDYGSSFPTNDRNGTKVIVTISGITPKLDATGNTVYSNTDNSGIYLPETEETSEKQVAPFAKPFVNRHSYTLTVGSENPDATFTVGTKLVTDAGEAINASDSVLSKVVLVSPDGTRQNYSSANNTIFTGMGNTVPAFYYENIPSGYKVQTTILTGDEKYNYYLRNDSETEADQRSLIPNEALVSEFSFDNHKMNVSSVAKTNSVIIKETVTGSFSNPEDVFQPTVYLALSDEGAVPSSTDIGDYTWVKDGENNRLTTTLDSIRGDNTEQIELLVPYGWKLFVSQENDPNQYYEVISKTYVEGDSGTPNAFPDTGLAIQNAITITIANSRDDIPATGVSDDSDHNWIVYILAGVGVLSAGVGAAYVYHRKRLVAER